MTGALMVIGMKYGMSESGDHDAFMTTFEKVGIFVEKFRALHGSLNCRDLLGLDVFDENDLKLFREKNIKLTQCIRYVEDAIRIVEEIV